MENKTERVVFTKEMRKTHKILLPNMSPVHFKIIEKVFINCGYNVEVLHNQGPSVVSEGLKYVHNDTCYPALLVIGQMIDALNSGKYDLQHTALMITQTGGGCRASNYIHLLRKALIKAGYEYIPVISLNMSGLESNPGFSITVPMLRKAVAAVVYGDCLMHLHNQIKPYAVNKDDCDKLLNHLSDGIADMLNDGHGYSLKEMTPILAGIAKSYSEVKTDGKKRIKVGVVGEIYVKYAPLGNNNLEEFLASQDCEYMLPGIMGFALFKVDNRLEDIHLYGGNPVKYAGVKVLMDYLTKMESAMINAIKVYPQFCPPTPYAHIKTLVKGVVGYGSKMGEGWLLTAEMLELAENGYENIVCTQPFGCLPNHINGKGMIRKIKEKNSRANIVPIDYDPSATRVNQENRIKLMLAVAKEQMEN